MKISLDTNAQTNKTSNQFYSQANPEMKMLNQIESLDTLSKIDQAFLNDYSDFPEITLLKIESETSKKRKTRK